MKNRVQINPVLVNHSCYGTLTARAVQVFAEEVELHSGIHPETSPIYLANRSNIVICTAEELETVAPAYRSRLDRIPAAGKEGFRIFTLLEGNASYSIFVVGSDPRGAFFGMGRLLRELVLLPDQMQLDLLMEDISSTPRYPLRGHQLGYRDKQNTCPCWTQRDYDRYIRDLALFGANSIELVPPNTDDFLFSRVMQVHPFKMMCDVSEIIHSYGLDVWLWYPNMAEHYDEPEVMAREVAEHEEVYGKIPYLDAVLIPAGDPGELLPDEFFHVSGLFSKILHKHHPKATIWIAPQCFDPDDSWMDDFYRNLDTQPDWLYGICHGPWNPDTLSEMHDRAPAKYKNRIRFYPDITHNLGCQFAMHNWDEAFGIIEGRECNNTRPRDMKYIHNLYTPLTLGGLTYSEGIHDDVNKFIWTQQDWDPDQSCVQTLREYARYLIDPTLEELLVKGFLGLEDNWKCPLPIAENTTVDDTYRLWCSIDAMASPRTRENYRYQMGMLRALGDYYIRHKQIYDLTNEQAAIELLRTATPANVDHVMREAAAFLTLSTDEPWDDNLRNRILRFADSLHEKCGIKLTSKRHRGQRWERGAWVDMIDYPLNNSTYMLGILRGLWEQSDPTAKVAGLLAMLNRTDPGEGGIYCNAGSREAMHCFELPCSWEADPEHHALPFGHTDRVGLRLGYNLKGTHRERLVPKEWITQMVTYYRQPLVAHFDLDPAACYKLRVVYSPAFTSDLSLKLTAGDGTVIHSSIAQGSAEHEFTLPKQCYADGKVTLTWTATERYGGTCLNELMLIKC